MSSAVHITRWGEAGPRVVLIHGGVQGSSLSGAGHFTAQQRLAAQGFQLIVPDRPGHGKSPSPVAYAPERTMLLRGYGKSYALTGLRLGFAAGPEASFTEMG